MKNINRRHTPYTKFKAFLDEKSITQSEVATMLEKTTSAINQNLNGTGGDFSVSEVRTICLSYGISADEYFLYPEVSNTKQTVTSVV